MKTKKEKVEKKIEVKDLKKTDTKKISTFKKKKKVKKNITSGIAYVYSTFNNTIISIADENGNVVSYHPQELRDSRVQENLHLMLHKLLLMMLDQKLLNKD